MKFEIVHPCDAPADAEAEATRRAVAAEGVEGFLAS